LGRLDPAALSEFGHLLETFVVGEILKQASWTGDIAGVGHWRTHDGHEVDLVIERRRQMEVLTGVIEHLRRPRLEHRPFTEADRPGTGIVWLSGPPSMFATTIPSCRPIIDSC